ncbi:MAG: ZIP family metal transporter [Oscillospiraceae bacterium]|jgi:ZIP family zinc transporter|nr:ZIP family metal transporter [Oscillospiraceae bacterium]
MNPDLLYPFALSLAAGLSTAAGGIIVFFIKNRESSGILGFALGFSAGVMTVVSFGDLMPEAVGMLSSGFGIFAAAAAAAAMIAGVVLSFFIESKIPLNQENQLGRVGLISMLALITHNLPEGMATYLSAYKDLSLGVSVSLAIALHNLPEGIAIAVPIYYSSASRARAIGYSLLSGLSEPAGAVLAALALRPFLTDTVLGLLFGLISGIMLCLSFRDLLPAAQGYGGMKTSLFGLFAGFIIMGIGIY